MTNLEYLEKAKRIDDDRSKNLNEFPERVSEWEIEYRKMKALEIIAEELIKNNLTLKEVKPNE